MKIFFFVRSMAAGGTQRQIALLANGLAKRSHDVAVIVLYGGGAMETLLANGRVRLLRLGKAGRWDVFGPLLRLRRLLRNERPDILYAFQPTQAVISALLLPNCRHTLVLGVRATKLEDERYDWLSALLLRAEAWLSGRAALIISNSAAGRDDAIARGMPPDRMFVVPNGIETKAAGPNPMARRAFRRQWGIADGAFVIGMLARLDPMKDHDTFLQAAAECARLIPDAHFVCAGGGPQTYREQLEAQSRSLGLGSRVTWASEVDDVRGALSAFDLATSSSAFGEGFSNAIGEAMACERPVVATDVGDAAVIIDGHGEVVPPRRPDLLCAAWLRLRERLAREPDLGVEARKSIEARFGVEMLIERTELILKRLVGTPQ